MGDDQGQPRLVADVGGTNTRIALFDPENPGLQALQTYTNRDYGQLTEVIQAWLNTLDVPRPEACCIAVAAPGNDDRVEMVNMDWSFSRRELIHDTAFTAARWLNDFEANAFCLPYLEPQDQFVIHAGDGTTGDLATVGPGTGLGGAVLRRQSGQPVARACEPGHTGLSPATDIELELFRYLYQEHGEVYTELLVSGPGLPRIYLGLAQVMNLPVLSAQQPAEIASRALAAEEELALNALQTFCALLGSACGDFVLSNGAYGGLYLAGGIIPRMKEFLAGSEFHQRFIAKGAMSKHLDRIPVTVICHPQPGLLGAAHAPL